MAGRQRHSPRQEVVIRQSKAVIKRRPRAIRRQNTVVRGKRQIGPEKKNHVKWKNKTWALGGEKKCTEAEGEGLFILMLA